MKASYSEKNFSFVAERPDKKDTVSQDSITIELGNSAPSKETEIPFLYFTFMKFVRSIAIWYAIW